MTHTRRRPFSPVSVKTVLAIALSLGASYALLQPPFAVSEEREHMARLEELSAFELASPADTDGPYHLVVPELERLATTYEPRVRKWRARTEFRELLRDLTAHSAAALPLRVASQTARLSRLSDLPLVPSYWLGRLLGLSLLAQLYLARLSGVLCFAWLASWATARAGRLGWAFFTFATLPMTLMQVGGVSGEALSHGLSLCFFALIARGVHEPEAHGLGERPRLLALALLAALVVCQPLMLLAAACLLALPADAPVRPLLRGRPLFLLALALGCLSLLLWHYGNAPLTAVAAAAATREQWHFMTTHPIGVLFGLARSLLREVDSLSIEFAAFGGSLVDMARFSGGVIAALGGQLLLLLALGTNRTSAPAPGSRPGSAWLVAGLLVYGLAAMLLALLAQNEHDATILHALPTRTFALMAPASLIALSTIGHPGWARYLCARPSTRIVLPMLLINAFAMEALVGRYFVPSEHQWPY
jgi:hypothetical protein